MRIVVYLDAKEKEWTLKFCARLAQECRNVANQLGIGALAQRLKNENGLDLKDLVMIIRISREEGILQKDAAAIAKAIDRTGNGFAALFGQDLA